MEKRYVITQCINEVVLSWKIPNNLSFYTMSPFFGADIYFTNIKYHYDGGVLALCLFYEKVIKDVFAYLSSYI